MNTPTPSNSVVTEAMIEAGVTAWLAAGGHLCDSADLVGPIYLAMQSANTTGSGELVAYEPVRCGHEAYQGFCAHCGVPIINGVAKVPRPILAIATPDTDRVAVLTEALKRIDKDGHRLGHKGCIEVARAALSQPFGSKGGV